jgi:flagellar hook-associated protein 2
MEATSAASAGTHSIQVTQLADRDTYSSGGFTAADTSLNSGSDITLTVNQGGTESSLVVSSPTPTSVVNAINNSDLGLTARVVNTGVGANPYVVSVSGAEGATNAFTISSDVSEIFSSNPNDASYPTQLTTAADANLTMDGIAMARSSNTITDVLDGVTLNLSAEMSSSKTVSVNQNTAPAKQAIENLVAVYNDVETVFKSLNRGDNPDDELVGSLSGDSVFRRIHSTVKGTITDISSTTSNNISYFADIGVSFQRDGSLAIDETKLDAALSGSFSDVVQALTAGTDNQTQFGTFNRGLAGDASKDISDLLSTTGSVNRVVTTAEDKLSDFQEDLTDLDARMERVRARFVEQFSAMESIVDQMNSTRSSLKQQLDALPFNNRD